MNLPLGRASLLLRSLIVITALFLIAASSAVAAKEARVTQVVHDVKLLPSEAKPRAAELNAKVDEDTGVRTGADSRSELTFPDMTITRLGSYTIFSFNKGGRNVDLGSGTLLVRVPKDSGGGHINTAGCSVGVTGTTLILDAQRSGRNVLAVLEGGARLSLRKYPQEMKYVRGGQMLDVPPGAKTLPEPRDFDVDKLMHSHPLITNFPPLPSRDLIYASRPSQPVYQGQIATGPMLPPGPIFIRPGGLFPGFPGGGGHQNQPNPDLNQKPGDGEENGNGKGKDGKNKKKKQKPLPNSDSNSDSAPTANNKVANSQRLGPLLKGSGQSVPVKPTPTPVKKKKKP
jgi:hypothetical protein